MIRIDKIANDKIFNIFKLGVSKNVVEKIEYIYEKNLNEKSSYSNTLISFNTRGV